MSDGRLQVEGQSYQISPVSLGRVNPGQHRREICLQMKARGEKLRAILAQQQESVTIISSDGRQRCNISAHHAAREIAGGGFTGFGKRGIVLVIVADGAPRPGPFAPPSGIRAVMQAFPRLPHVDKNVQKPGAKKWVPQPVRARTGRMGREATVLVRRRRQHY